MAHSDKLYHTGAYGVLAVLGWRAYPPRRRGRRIGRSACWLAIWAAYGALDEWSQSFPGINRSASVADWGADLLGAALGLVAVQLYGWRATRTERSDRHGP